MKLEDTFNKGSYRIGKKGFNSLLFHMRKKGFEIVEEGQFHYAKKKDEVLRLEFKENGWITIT